jgi:hypothetical protein
VAAEFELCPELSSDAIWDKITNTAEMALWGRFRWNSSLAILRLLMRAILG